MRIAMKKVLLFGIVVLSCEFLFSQNSKSTNDLSFLLGQWDIEWIYNPESDTSRSLTGILSCEWTMDNKFIKCSYAIERPNKVQGLDRVFFNYNPIYDKYEYMWLSSTWPIKVLMQGDLATKGSTAQLSTASEFAIGNEVREYVRSKLVINMAEPDSFQRQTHIRTSKDDEGKWRHHMTEIARKRE